MKKPPQTEQASKLVRYWHPRLGGWYHARLLRIEDKGRKGKWAVVRDFKEQNHRVAIADVREVAA